MGMDASMIEFDEQRVNSGGQLSKYAAIKLQQFLRKVVTDEEGTGGLFSSFPMKSREKAEPLKLGY